MEVVAFSAIGRILLLVESHSNRSRCDSNLIIAKRSVIESPKPMYINHTSQRECFNPSLIPAPDSLVT